jgi:hypothetical protein
MIILSCGCQSGDFGIEADGTPFLGKESRRLNAGFICQKHFELYDAMNLGSHRSQTKGVEHNELYAA